MASPGRSPRPVLRAPDVPQAPTMPLPLSPPESSVNQPRAHPTPPPNFKPRVREPRLSEPHKLIPMIFVLSMIVGLYSVYTFMHLPRLLQLHLPHELREPGIENP